jgi:hypothetical protein
MEPVKPVVLPEIPDVEYKVGEAIDIEVLKVIIKDAFTLAAAAAQLIKKFDIAPLLTVATVLGKYGQNIDETFQAAWSELKDLDAEEARELIDEIKASFDIADDELEAKIEILFDLPLISFMEVKETIELVTVIIKVVKDPDIDFSQKLKELADLFPELINQGADVVEVAEKWIDAVKALIPPKDNQ